MNCTHVLITLEVISHFVWISCSRRNPLGSEGFVCF